MGIQNVYAVFAQVLIVIFMVKRIVYPIIFVCFSILILVVYVCRRKRLITIFCSDIFKSDHNFIENEKCCEELKKAILGDESKDEDGSDVAPDVEDDDEDEEEDSNEDDE